MVKRTVISGFKGNKAPEAKLALEDFLPYRLSVLSNTISRAISSAYGARFGLSIPEWRVIAVLGRFPGLSAAEVAERTAMDKVQISRTVAALLQSGRLERQMDKQDRRRSILRLSAEGQKIYQDVIPLARHYESQLLAALNDDETAMLDHLLEKLTRQAKEL